MTQQIECYKNEVYYNEISNQVFSENLFSMKNLIEEELELFGNFQNKNNNFNENMKNVDYDFDLLDQMMENIINLDSINNNKKMKKYEIANSFINKYSQK